MPYCPTSDYSAIGDTISCHAPYPDLPFLAFFEFLAFFSYKEFLACLSVFPFFPKDFRGSLGKKNPCFFGGFDCFLPKKQGKEDQGIAR